MSDLYGMRIVFDEKVPPQTYEVRQGQGEIAFHDRLEFETWAAIAKRLGVLVKNMT